MAKKKGVTVISGTVDEITTKLKRATEKLHTKIDPNERDYEVTEATIKDMLCNYSITITGDVNHGDRNKITGSGVVDKDMLAAMARFNVHLACIDDAFKTAGVQVTLDGVTHFESDGLSYGNIDQMRNHELTGNYVVTGFKIKGGTSNESVILIGTKYVSMAGDHMELQTPKIPLDQSSSYTWHNELSDVCELIREEVALYREGKYTEKEEREPKGKAGNMFDGPTLEERFERGELEGEELDMFLAGQTTNGNASSENLGE